jgi:hypothetical protein
MRQLLEFSTRDSRATAVLATTLGGVGLLLTIAVARLALGKE